MGNLGAQVSMVLLGVIMVVSQTVEGMIGNLLFFSFSEMGCYANIYTEREREGMNESRTNEIK